MNELMNFIESTPNWIFGAAVLLVGMIFFAIMKKLIKLALMIAALTILLLTIVKLLPE